MKCIILAGGSGERLWPLSRDLYPKSLLSLYGKKTLVQNIYELALSLATEKDIISVTNIRQYNDTYCQLKEISKNPLIISEPMSKNTAAATISALTFLKEKKDYIVVILPVDFSVKNKEKFMEAITEAEAAAKKGYIVALGIKPKYEEEGYGYIQAGEALKNNNKVKKVKKFIEKPSKDDVALYLKQKDIYWNSGIYIGKISVLLKEYAKYSGDYADTFTKDMFDENNKIKYEYYENLPEISIDYAITEKTDKLVFTELKTEWSDFGSWRSVYDNVEKDSHNNVIKGNVITDNVKDSFIYSSKELVAAADINNTVVIETEDAILVCDKSCSSDINKIVKELKKENNAITESRKTVFRPWGFYTCLNSGEGWLTKIISVSPGHKLSMQSHQYRSEHWVILEGTATVVIDDKIFTLEKGKSINIPIEAKHSLQNHSTLPLKILEVQKGSYINEDDIIRYEDMYGRVK